METHKVNGQPLVDALSGFEVDAFRATLKAVDGKKPDPAAVEKLKQLLLIFRASWRWATSSA